MKAVLFDMDGILIDTEKYLTVYKQKAMREAGYRLDLETAYKFRSCASAVVWNVITSFNSFFLIIQSQFQIQSPSR